MSAGVAGYTFTPATITTNPLDEARAWLRDVGTDGEWVFTDEYISSFVTLLGSPCRAAAFLARQRAVEVAASEGVSESIGDLSVSVQGSSQHWNDLAAAIEAMCSALAGALSAIGVGAQGSYADLPHLFQVGQHDSAGTGVAWSSGDPRYTLLDHWWRR